MFYFVRFRILDQRWRKALYEIHFVGMRMFVRDGTRKEKRQRYEELRKELGRLEALPKEDQHSNR